MTDMNPTSTVNSPSIAPQRSSPLVFLGVCGIFMLVGILFLAWLGTDRSRSAIGKELPPFGLDPLLNSERSWNSPQDVGQTTILYLWSPTATDARSNLKRMNQLATAHSTFSLVPIAFSNSELQLEELRETVQQALDQEGLSWPTFVDASGQASMELALSMPYGSFGFPTIFVIDQRGKIRYVCEAKKSEDWQALGRHLDSYVQAN